MAKAVFFISVFLIFFLILIQKVSIRVIKKELTLTIELEILLFKLTLTKAQNTEKKLPKKSKEPKKRNKALAKARASAIRALLGTSDIEVNRLQISVPNSEPHIFAVGYESFFSLISLLSAFAAQNTKSVSYKPENLLITTEKEQAFVLDISFFTRLYGILTAALLFSFDFTKNKIKEIRKRKPNTAK